MSAVSWGNVDGFQKFKIMVVLLDITMEKDEKQHYSCLFSMILKNSQMIPLIDELKLSFVRWQM